MHIVDDIHIQYDASHLQRLISDIFFIDLITLSSLLTDAIGEYQMEIRICLWYVNDRDVVQNHVFEPCSWMNY